MLENLVRYVLSSSSEAIHALSAEDIALCGAWADSFAGFPSESERVDALRAAVSNWKRASRLSSEPVEGVRLQPLLRKYVDALLRGEVNSLAWDEASFLFFAYELLCRDSGEIDKKARYCQFVTPYVGEMRQIVECKDVLPGLPNLSGHVGFIGDVDLEGLPSRHVKMLAGIDVSFSGAVYSSAEPLKILGSVPHHVLVSVDSEFCIVEGYVLGVLATVGDCDVRENIAGTVISRRGDIRGRNIVNKAFVVSKNGSVFCRKVMEPRLVFAGEKIRVEESVLGGDLIANEISVGNEINGGRYQVSGELKAPKIRRPHGRSCIVVLRKTLTGEDYGEVANESANRLVAGVAKLRQRIADLENGIENSEREADQGASTTLLHILGGDTQAAELAESEKIKRRLAMLSRMIPGLRLLILATEEKMAKAQRQRGAKLVPEPEPSASSITDALIRFERDLEIDGDIKAAVASAERSLSTRFYDKRLAMDALQDLRDRTDRWTRERDTLSIELDQRMSELNRRLDRMALIERLGKDASRAEILASLASALQDRPDDDPLKIKSQAPFIRLMISNVNRCRSRAKEYRSELDSVVTEHGRMCEQLRRDFQIIVGGDSSASRTPVRVTSRFEGGVVVANSMESAERRSSLKGTVVETVDTGQTVVSYVLMDDGLVQHVEE